MRVDFLKYLHKINIGLNMIIKHVKTISTINP